MWCTRLSYGLLCYMSKSFDTNKAVAILLVSKIHATNSLVSEVNASKRAVYFLPRLLATLWVEALPTT